MPTRVNGFPKEVHKNVGILVDKDTVLLENCGTIRYEECGDGIKIYAGSPTIARVFEDGKCGEVQRINNRTYRWRKRTPSTYSSRTVWRNHPLEVSVLNFPNVPDDEHLLQSIMDWRDWVEYYGGSISGTVSSASYSIFKKTLKDGDFAPPYIRFPIENVVGGRVLPCKQLRADVSGFFIQWDLHSAYSRRLGNLQYGGRGSRWVEVRRARMNLEKMSQEGRLIYVEAEVYIPKGLRFGPLPVRRDSQSRRQVSTTSFPVGQLLSGTWTYEEVKMAEDCGCRVTWGRTFVHMATGKRYHFQDWYRAIEEGRDNLHGFARGLAKQTGNTLWGHFCMQPRQSRTTWYQRVDGKWRKKWERRPGYKTTKRKTAFELPDQLCGKIRAELSQLGYSAGDDLIQGNTDGAWVAYKDGWHPPNDQWRNKNEANRIRILDDVTYKYYSEDQGEVLIFPGINTEWADRIFERKMLRAPELLRH